ncbi:MAG: hypothetical protein ACODAF_00360 [Actinomycetota bacterium]
MIAFGLLLLAVAAALAFVAVWEGGGTLAVEAFGVAVDTTIWSVFLAGVATGVIAVAGVVVMSAGIRRKREHAREFEYLRQRVAEQEAEHDDAEPGARQGSGHGQPGSSDHVPYRPAPPMPRTAATYRTPQT